MCICLCVCVCTIKTYNEIRCGCYVIKPILLECLFTVITPKRQTKTSRMQLKVAAEWLALCIQEDPGSNLVSEAGYREVFRCVPLSPVWRIDRIDTTQECDRRNCGPQEIKYFRHFKYHRRTGGTCEDRSRISKSSVGGNMHSRSHKRKDQFGSFDGRHGMQISMDVQRQRVCSVIYHAQQNTTHTNISSISWMQYRNTITELNTTPCLLLYAFSLLTAERRNSLWWHVGSIASSILSFLRHSGQVDRIKVRTIRQVHSRTSLWNFKKVVLIAQAHPYMWRGGGYSSLYAETSQQVPRENTH
jgi:hypothetical protein